MHDRIFEIQMELLSNAEEYESKSEAGDYGTPRLALCEGYIEWEGFPAISKDGSRVVYVHQENSCCVDTDAELIVQNVRTGAIEYSEIISPSNDVSEPYTEIQLLDI